MGKFVTGDVVVTVFPFSDLSTSKHRPAVVLAEVEFGDLVLCQITSKPYSSQTAIRITAADFASGNLAVESYVRPDKLFTSELTLIKNTAGHLSDHCVTVVLEHVRQLFRGPSKKF